MSITETDNTKEGEKWRIAETKEPMLCKTCLGEMIVFQCVNQIVILCPKGCRP